MTTYSGTTISVAEKLGRQWIGVDISHLATRLISKRLIETYGIKIRETFELYGFPKDVDSARVLAEKAEHGRIKFQEWVIEAELGGICNPKKTADGGWDGHITFDYQGKKGTVLIEVKSGNINVKNLREFIHVIETQGAAMGLFVCFADQITKPMQHEAATQGYCFEEFYGNRYPKIQIVSVDSLLEKRYPTIPAAIKETTFKMAALREEKADGSQEELPI